MDISVLCRLICVKVPCLQKVKEPSGAYPELLGAVQVALARGPAHPGCLCTNAWAGGKASIRQEGMGHLKGRGVSVAREPMTRARMGPPPQAAAPRSLEGASLIRG